MRTDEHINNLGVHMDKECRRTTLAKEGKAGKPNSHFQPARDTPRMKAPHLQPRSALLKLGGQHYIRILIENLS